MGGGSMRAAAKLTGVTVATGGIRGITAKHIPISSSKRGPFSVRTVATTISSGEEMKLVSSQSQNQCSEIDNWVYTVGDEKMIMCAGEPMLRAVFGGAPTLQAAKEATFELAVTLEKLAGVIVAIVQGVNLNKYCGWCRYMNRLCSFEMVEL